MRTVETTWQRTSRQRVTAGAELRVKGLGYVRFRQVVTLPDGRQYVDVVSPTWGFYSVRPERVVSVPRKQHLRPRNDRSLAVAS